MMIEGDLPKGSFILEEENPLTIQANWQNQALFRICCE
jgi:hypothetical protein